MRLFSGLYFSVKKRNLGFLSLFFFFFLRESSGGMTDVLASFNEIPPFIVSLLCS